MPPPKTSEAPSTPPPPDPQQDELEEPNNDAPLDPEKVDMLEEGGGAAGAGKGDEGKGDDNRSSKDRKDQKNRDVIEGDNGEEFTKETGVGVDDGESERADEVYGYRVPGYASVADNTRAIQTITLSDLLRAQQQKLRPQNYQARLSNLLVNTLLRRRLDL